VRRPARGQAAIELLAMVPVLVLAGLVAWQLAAVLVAGMAAERDVRERALRATAVPGAIVVVSATSEVPAVLPPVTGLRIAARAGVRVP
jgi:hypothetical protein